MNKTKFKKTKASLLLLIVILGAFTTAYAQRVPKVIYAGTICNNNVFSGTLGTTVSGQTVSWTRPAVTGISNTTSNGTTSAISETLINTTTNPIIVNYLISSVAGACPRVDTISLTVFPTPVINNTTNYTICDSTTFNYTATTLTAGTTFSWSRATVTGIANPAATGNNAVVSEILQNNTTSDIIVTYLFTLSANGCSNTIPVTLTVKPTPNPTFTRIS
jgi:hypothetical protein